MKRTKGFSLVETLVGSGLLALLFMISASLFNSAFTSFRKTDTRLDLSERTAIAMRRMAQDLRSAAVVTISGGGSTVTFQMPAYNATADAVTGELEYQDPIVGDGVNRQYYVSGGKLYYRVGSGTPEMIASNIATVDPEPGSSTYNQSYAVFSASSVASTNGITIFLISRKSLSRSTEWVRMSTTLKLRNKI